MINLQLANILTDISEIKKSEAASRAVTAGLVTAARTIRDSAESIEKIYKSSRLKELPGMEGLAYELIAEYMETGKIGLYEELISVYPEDLVRLIRISGFGRKRIFKIYDVLKVKSLEDLKEKLTKKNTADKISGAMSEIGSAGSKNSLFYVKRLKDSINYIENIKGLYPRWKVELYLNEIKDMLYKLKDVEKVLVVGSVRRKKYAVKDIDILILPGFNRGFYDTSKSIKLLEEIRSLEFVREYKGSNVKFESVSAGFETNFGIEAEFIISSHKNWAVDMISTTGSSEHVEKIKEIAGKNGFIRNDRIEISGSAFKEGQPFKNCIPGHNYNCEENVYRKLGLQYIPPELRENNGEIEMAGRNRLPLLVTMEDIKGDLHIHSEWSDGIITLDDMIERVRKFNYEYIAITDHSISNYYGRGLNDEGLQRKMSYINKLNSRFKGFKILMGSEIDINGAGRFDYPEKIIKKLDIAIGSMHSSFLNSEAENTARAVSGIKNKYIDFIAHPTGVVLGSRAPYSIDIGELIDEAAKNGKALEINSYFLRVDLDEQNAKKAAGAGVKLVINTDSHRANNMDMIKLGVDTARRAGLEKKDILNTLPLNELMAWKKKRS